MATQRIVVVFVLLALFAATSLALTPEIEDFLHRLTRDRDSIKNGEFSYWRLLKKSTEEDAVLATDDDYVTVFLQVNMLARAPFILRGEKPVRFRVNETIYAVSSMLKKMRPGDRIQMWVPVEWAYANQGYGVAKPDELMVFDIELVRVNSLRGQQPDYTQPPFLIGIVEYNKKLKEMLEGKESEEKNSAEEEANYKTGL